MDVTNNLASAWNCFTIILSSLSYCDLHDDCQADLFDITKLSVIIRCESHCLISFKMISPRFAKCSTLAFDDSLNFPLT